MKPIYYFLVTLIFLAGACKKSKTSEYSDDQKTIKRIEENYHGAISRYILTYNNEDLLQSFESEDGRLMTHYTYNNRKPTKIDYKIDSVAYQLSLNYNSQGVPENGSFTVSRESGKITTDTILANTIDGEIKLDFFNGVYSCTIKNGNLTNAEFYTWFFKRKFAVTYGSEQGQSFISTVVIPKEEISFPIFPSDDRYAVIFHMLISAFTKNNVLSVDSELFKRSFSYEKDKDGRVKSSTIQVVKTVEGEMQPVGVKQIIYYY